DIAQSLRDKNVSNRVSPPESEWRQHGYGDKLVDAYVPGRGWQGAAETERCQQKECGRHRNLQPQGSAPDDDAERVEGPNRRRQTSEYSKTADIVERACALDDAAGDRKQIGLQRRRPPTSRHERPEARLKSPRDRKPHE